MGHAMTNRIPSKEPAQSAKLKRVPAATRDRAAPLHGSPRSGRGTETPLGSTVIDELCINTIRTLSMDAVQQAASGHPGTPMALAPLAYTLWQNFLRFDPEDPQW